MDTSAASPATAVVVGATGALGGQATATLLARGLRVIAVARDAEKLEALAEQHPGVVACPADIADDAAIDAIAASVREQDLRMIFMGAGLPVRGSVETAAPGDYGVAMNVKIGGLARLLRATGDRLRPGSRIVALSGYHGVEPRAHESMPGVVNAALHNFIRQLSQLYGPRGVTVHAISPGPVDTPRMRRIAAAAAAERGVSLAEQLELNLQEASLARLIELEDIGWAVGLLLDRQADALHGSVLSMDGGRLRSVL